MTDLLIQNGNEVEVTSEFDSSHPPPWATWKKKDTTEEKIFSYNRRTLNHVKMNHEGKKAPHEMWVRRRKTTINNKNASNTTITTTGLGVVVVFDHQQVSLAPRLVEISTLNTNRLNMAEVALSRTQMLSRKVVISILHDLRDNEPSCHDKWWTLEKMKTLIEHIYGVGGDSSATISERVIRETFSLLQEGADNSGYRYHLARWSTRDPVTGKRSHFQKGVVFVPGKTSPYFPTDKKEWEDIIKETNTIIVGNLLSDYEYQLTNDLLGKSDNAICQFLIDHQLHRHKKQFPRVSYWTSTEARKLFRPNSNETI